MSSPTSTFDKPTQQFQQNIIFLSNKNINNLYKPLILIGLFLFLFYILLSNRHLDQSPHYLARLSQALYTNHNTEIYPPTNISHIVIAIAGSVNAWKFRRPYIESWWQPNVTKGYIYLDRDPTNFLPWPNNSVPPYRVSENTLRYKPFDKHPMRSAIRLFRVIAETFKETRDQDIRWYIMTDDDTILFLDNLVYVLQKYDHRQFFYLGNYAESVLSNFDNSFKMAFGGAGYAISYPLAEALAKNVDICIKRHPFVFGSDHLMQSCVADLGAPFTQQQGFHQIDLHRDLLGFLSAHPRDPVLSLHHLDMVDPLFPGMNRLDSLNHLMKAAKVDQSRLFQQTICYNKPRSWSFTTSWGYTVQMYEIFIPQSILEIPLETFSAWRLPPKHPFMFNTRRLSKNPCDIPHVFYLQSIENNTRNNEVVTSYTRRTTRNVPLCGRPKKNPGDITKIIVVSPATKYLGQARTRRECCDVLDQQIGKNIITIKYRACEKNELLGIE